MGAELAHELHHRGGGPMQRLQREAAPRQRRKRVALRQTRVREADPPVPHAERRDGLLAYVTALARDDFDALSSVESTPVEAVEIPYTGQAFHVDGEIRPAADRGQPPVGGMVNIKVLPGALKVLLPAAAQAPAS